VKELLTAESLGNLSEGYVGKMLQRALSDVTKDIYDRGHDRQKRKIVLTLDFAQRANQDARVRPADDNRQIQQRGEWY